MWQIGGNAKLYTLENRLFDVTLQEEARFSPRLRASKGMFNFFLKNYELKNWQIHIQHWRLAERHSTDWFTFGQHDNNINRQMLKSATVISTNTNVMKMLNWYQQNIANTQEKRWLINLWNAMHQKWVHIIYAVYTVQQSYNMRQSTAKSPHNHAVVL